MNGRSLPTTGDLDKLIELADSILQSTERDQQFVDNLAKYAEDFEAWFIAYENSVKDQKPLNTREEMEQLLERHEKLVNLSQDVQGDYPDEMIKLKQKGKGIMAYTDTLPKKVSFTKLKKG